MFDVFQAESVADAYAEGAVVVDEEVGEWRGDDAGRCGGGNGGGMGRFERGGWGGIGEQAREGGTERKGGCYESHGVVGDGGGGGGEEMLMGEGMDREELLLYSHK